MSTKFFLKIRKQENEKNQQKKIERSDDYDCTDNIKEIEFYRDKNNIPNRIANVGVHFFYADKNPYSKKTSYPCWWCRYSFDFLPLPLPILKKFDKNKNDEKVTNIFGHGIFCSLECAYAYICDHNEKLYYKRDTKIVKICYYLFLV